MILWSGKVDTEKEIAFQDMGRRSWRWVLESDVWRDCERLFGVGIGFAQQYRCERDGDEWARAIHYYEVTVTRHFAIGEEHAYYDGPHCSFSIGWIHFCWSGDWCLKCMPDESDARAA
jgi:hypothetical protein